MFNFYAVDVQINLEQVRQHAQQVQEIDGQIRKAVQIVQDGAWEGEAELKFLEDSARLRTETETLYNELEQFAGALTQAASTTQEAIGQIHTIVASLP
jgi:WXG100 family type VII secretion target